MDLLSKIKQKILLTFFDYNSLKIETSLEETFLSFCIRQNEIKKAKDLLDNGKIDIENIFGTTKYSALGFSTALGKKEMIKLFLSYNANVNFQDKFGVTSLMQASALGNLEIVELLLENKADVNLKDKDNFTALDYAEFYENERIAKILKHHQS